MQAMGSTSPPQSWASLPQGLCSCCSPWAVLSVMSQLDSLQTVHGGPKRYLGRTGSLTGQGQLGHLLFWASGTASTHSTPTGLGDSPPVTQLPIAIQGLQHPGGGLPLGQKQQHRLVLGQALRAEEMAVDRVHGLPGEERSSPTFLSLPWIWAKRTLSLEIRPQPLSRCGLQEAGRAGGWGSGTGPPPGLQTRPPDCS